MYGLLYLDAVGKISGWIDLHEYEVLVPRLQSQARLWIGLAVTFPFLAALLLGRGKAEGQDIQETTRRTIITTHEVPQGWTAVTAILEYLLRVAVSALGSVAFAVAFVLVLSLLEKLGVRAH